MDTKNFFFSAGNIILRYSAKIGIFQIRLYNFSGILKSWVGSNFFEN
jgi:hypothetical protein